MRRAIRRRLAEAGKLACVCLSDVRENEAEKATAVECADWLLDGRRCVAGGSLPRAACCTWQVTSNFTCATSYIQFIVYRRGVYVVRIVSTWSTDAPRSRMTV